MDLTDLSDARRGKRNGVIRFTPAQRAARWKARHPEYVQKKGPLGLMLHNVRRGAKTRGLDFSISAADFPTLPTHCPVLGIELSYVGSSDLNPRSKSKASRASIDRKDNSLGYVPGNVFIISFRANQLKSDGTASELRALANWMEK
jgi:hypothetical protein